MKAIVYTTNTGSTAQYAKMLAEETGLPAFSAGEAKSKVAPGSEVIYFGWIMASKVKGFDSAAKKYNVRAVCAVGMEKSGTRAEEIRGKSFVPTEIPLFTLQGNFDVKKLRGIYRIMMNLMVKIVSKQLGEKKELTAREEEMLSAMMHGGENVKAENLKPVLEWFSKEGKNEQKY